MAKKPIKLKCVSGRTTEHREGRLYRGYVLKDGSLAVKFGGGHIPLNSRLEMENSLVGITSRFVQLKTKTLKCMRLVGAQQKGTFKPGKRYQIESGRALGAVAGYIFNETGEPWCLYREAVGFSCAIALFEAKYL